MIQLIANIQPLAHGVLGPKTAFMNRCYLVFASPVNMSRRNYHSLRTSP